jgi:hypothetical protein
MGDDAGSSFARLVGGDVLEESVFGGEVCDASPYSFLDKVSPKRRALSRIAVAFLLLPVSRNAALFDGVWATDPLGACLDKDTIAVLSVVKYLVPFRFS